VVLDINREIERSELTKKDEPVIYRKTERNIFDPARRIAYRAESRRRLRQASGII
jgi:hypothetical protein